MQDRASIAAGDRRLRALAGDRVALVVFLGALVTLFHVAVVVWVAFAVTTGDGPRTIESDFRVIWAAARLLLDGEPLAAFDLARLSGEYGEASDSWMPWLYPPGYLLLVAPFGTLPYTAAFLVMTLVSLVAIALATRPFAGGVKPVWAALCLAPAYMPALLIGQNSLIWLAGLLAALLALRSGRGLLAGVILGCLTLKPQLGVMIPLALLAAGQWRAILAAAVTALALAVLPTLVVGVAYWPLLADQLGAHADRIAGMAGALDLLVNPQFVATLIGLPAQPALWLQAGFLAISAVSVLVFWRSGHLGFDARAALLLIAMLLSAPYLWYYEAALTAAVGLFLVRAGVLTTRPLHLLLLVLLWLGAGLQSANVFLQILPDRYLGGLIVTPALTIALVLCWRHFLVARSIGNDPH